MSDENTLTEPRNVIYGLRCLCHPERGIRYVGQTTQGASLRLRDHRKGSRYPKWAVQHWIKKHGERNVVSDTLEVLEDRTGLNRAEEYWIAKLRTFCDWGEGGLNLTRGGDHPTIDSEAAREKARLKNSGEQSWSKLTWDSVRELRWKYQNEYESVSELAEFYGVSVTVCSDAIQGKSWIDPDYVFMPRDVVISRQRKPYVRQGLKLTQAEADEIRVLYNEDGVSTQYLSETYRIGYSSVTSILNNERYVDPSYRRTRKRATPPEFTDEHRAKLSAAGKGKKKPEGFGAKVSAAVTGEKHGMAKLTEQQVKDIIALMAEGWTNRQVEAEYKISNAQANRIRKGLRWSHLERPWAVD